MYIEFYYDKLLKNSEEESKKLQNISTNYNNLSKTRCKLLNEIREQNLSSQNLFQKVKEKVYW